MIAVTLSLMLIVCSTVMVSRATGEVNRLEGEIEALEYERADLEGKLNMKNDMLHIKDVAINPYGMISGEYADSKYVDVTGEDKKWQVQEIKHLEGAFDRDSARPRGYFRH